MAPKDFAYRRSARLPNRTFVTIVNDIPAEEFRRMASRDLAHVPFAELREAAQRELRNINKGGDIARGLGSNPKRLARLAQIALKYGPKVARAIAVYGPNLLPLPLRLAWHLFDLLEWLEEIEKLLERLAGKHSKIPYNFQESMEAYIRRWQVFNNKLLKASQAVSPHWDFKAWTPYYQSGQPIVTDFAHAMKYLSASTTTRYTTVASRDQSAPSGAYQYRSFIQAAGRATPMPPPNQSLDQWKAAECWRAPLANTNPPVFVPQVNTPAVFLSLPEAMPQGQVNPGSDRKLPLPLREAIKGFPESYQEGYGSREDPGIETGINPRFTPRVSWRVGRHPKIERVLYRQKPGRRTKESKAASSSGMLIKLLVKVAGALAEYADLVNAIYKSLPKAYRLHIRYTYKNASGNWVHFWKRATLGDKERCIWNAAVNGKIDAAAAAWEVMWNQIGDAFYGRIGTKMKKSVRKAADSGYWNSITGLQAGQSTQRKLQGEDVPDDPIAALKKVVESTIGLDSYLEEVRNIDARAKSNRKPSKAGTYKGSIRVKRGSRWNG